MRPRRAPAHDSFSHCTTVSLFAKDFVGVLAQITLVDCRRLHNDRHLGAEAQMHKQLHVLLVHAKLLPYRHLLLDTHALLHTHRQRETRWRCTR